jgi:hypothetical protein
LAYSDNPCSDRQGIRPRAELVHGRDILQTGDNFVQLGLVHERKVLTYLEKIAVRISPDAHPSSEPPTESAVFGLKELKKFISGELLDFHLSQTVIFANRGNEEDI